MTHRIGILLALKLTLLAGFTSACGGPPAPPENAEVEVGVVRIDDFATAARFLPPSPIGLVWADVDALSSGPVGEMLEDIPDDAPLPDAAPVAFLKEHMGRIHTVAGGLWVTMTGQAVLVVLDTELETQALFERVKEWAESRGASATPARIRGRPGLRTGPTVLVDAGDGVFINGPAGLAGRVLDLADRKTTGDAADEVTDYLAARTIHEDAALVVSGVTPPTANGWLQSKHLPSLVGSRFMLSANAPERVGLRLGLLPGEPIKPIWFAQEVNTFLVRASKDEGMKELGIDEWLLGLDVELLSEGIVVEGSMEAGRLVEVLGELGGET